jgi:hypothetical protein
VKFLLFPFAIVAFVAFLLLLGAIGLTIALGVLWVFGRAWGLVSRSGRPRRS